MENRNNMWRFPIDESRKREGLAEIRQQVMSKRVRFYPSFFQSIWNQMRYQPWSHWVLEGGLLLLCMLFIFYLQGKNRADEHEMLAAASVFFVFAGNIVLSSTARLFSWHMAELEQTLYLNLKQMVCIRMMEAGIMSVLVLGLLLSMVGEESPKGAFMCLVYMLVPFLWSNAFYLHMLGFFRNVASGFRSLVSGLICGMLSCFPLMWEDVYAPEYRQAWYLLAAAGAVLVALEFRRILEKIEGGDSICLN